MVVKRAVLLLAETCWIFRVMSPLHAGVTSFRSIHVIAFLAELNELQLAGNDIGNACLTSEVKEKVHCIVAGREFQHGSVNLKGHLLQVVAALCELRSSGSA